MLNPPSAGSWLDFDDHVMSFCSRGPMEPRDTISSPTSARMAGEEEGGGAALRQLTVGKVTS